jgi:hypothetical protein
MSVVAEDPDILTPRQAATFISELMKSFADLSPMYRSMNSMGYNKEIYFSLVRKNSVMLGRKELEYIVPFITPFLQVMNEEANSRMNMSVVDRPPIVDKKLGFEGTPKENLYIAFLKKEFSVSAIFAISGLLLAFVCYTALMPKYESTRRYIIPLVCAFGLISVAVALDQMPLGTEVCTARTVLWTVGTSMLYG